MGINKVLRSLKENQFYVGLTTDLLKRVQQHNSGPVISTKKRVPFELTYWEGCSMKVTQLNRALSQKRMG